MLLLRLLALVMFAVLARAGEAPEAKPQPQEAAAVVEARGPVVELYTTSWCRWCKKAKEYMASKGIEFVEHDVEKDPGAAQRRKELDPRPGVPFAWINGRGVLGYSEAAYEKALKTAAQKGERVP